MNISDFIGLLKKSIDKDYKKVATEKKMIKMILFLFHEYEFIFRDKHIFNIIRYSRLWISPGAIQHNISNVEG